MSLSDISTSTKTELIYLICGKLIGSGMTRDVYEFAFDSDYVVKIEDKEGHFQNVIEWQTWQEVRETKWAKWFAPCHSISFNGSVLIQRKVKAVELKELPNKLPSFFTDFKTSNFGRLGKQIVACDYGCNLLMSNGLSDKMRKCHWND